MTLAKPKNPNYCATVIKINHINHLPNSDNLVGIPLFGLQAIVSKDTEMGEVGIVFPCEVQLSDDYCSNNNLYRHPEYNSNKELSGYLEDNRRVRAIKLRGNHSDALFMPLSSLSFTGDVSDLNIGDEFDEINGIEICRKYIIPTKHTGGQNVAKARKESRVEAIHMPEHFETTNLFKVIDTLDQSTQVILTQKLHGTSVRIGFVPTKRKLSWLEKLTKLFGCAIMETEYSPVYASRKVIKQVGDEPN